MERTALFSPCGRYRYRLGRRWGDGRGGATVLWIMLNPSTADEQRDDPTIRRCIGFSRAWGFGAAEMVNLFALRSTDPGVLRVVADPVGPANGAHILEAAGEAAVLIAAWGGDRFAQARGGEILSHLRDRPVWCLGLTQSGAPRHPLYVPGRVRRIRLPRGAATVPCARG